jgi:pimeloyl-ACP methyl ester carboxylesterase
MRQRWQPRTLDGDLFTLVHEGRRDLAPVVLLHGAGGNARTWTVIAPALGERTIILVDMPGHGCSAAARTWELGSTASLLRASLAPALEGRPAVWGGHSWGGKVAGLVAAADPAACAGLLLFDPSPSTSVPIDPPAFVEDNWEIEMRPYASPEEALHAARGLIQWQPWNEEVEAAFLHGLAQRSDGTWSLRPTREDLVALVTAVLHVDAREALARAASVPTLLLVASQSLPWQEITNMSLYTSATCEVLDGHHWIHACNPEAVMRCLRDWLARLAA